MKKVYTIALKPAACFAQEEVVAINMYFSEHEEEMSDFEAKEVLDHEGTREAFLAARALGKANIALSSQHAALMGLLKFWMDAKDASFANEIALKIWGKIRQMDDWNDADLMEWLTN